MLRVGNLLTTYEEHILHYDGNRQEIGRFLSPRMASCTSPDDSNKSALLNSPVYAMSCPGCMCMNM